MKIGPYLAWFALVCACQAGGVQERFEAPKLPNNQATEQTSQRNETGQDAQEEIARLLEQVVQRRQLPSLSPVKGRVIDRPTMIEQVKQQVREQVPQQAIHGEKAFLAAFGFIPQDYDYEGEMYRLMESQIAGYYDPTRKALFVMEDLEGPEAEVTLAHELVHALQDQHYDLDSLLKYQPGQNDERAAVHCLAEGDATSLMLDYGLGQTNVMAPDIPDAQLRLQLVTGMAVSPQFTSFPRILRESLIAPYLDGVLFVHALRREGGWALVDRVWKNLPTTTEQVLHLDKFDSREAAEEIRTVAPPSQGQWSVIHEEVYGEQGLRIALEEWLPRRVAARAAAGWGGDLAVVFQQDSGVVMAAWHIVFDATVGKQSDGEAKEAYEAIIEAWKGRGPRRGCHSLGDGRVLALVKQGRSLVFVTDKMPQNQAGNAAEGSCSHLQQWANTIAVSK